MSWPSTWPNEYGEGYQLYTGSYGGTDDRFKRRKKKQPLGFAPPRPPSAPKRKKT
jgi:hypothetical protein